MTPVRESPDSGESAGGKVAAQPLLVFWGVSGESLFKGFYGISRLLEGFLEGFGKGLLENFLCRIRKGGCGGSSLGWWGSGLGFRGP